MKLHLNKKNKLKKLVDPGYAESSTTREELLNHNNRFNDVQLNQKFSWTKKKEKEKEMGLSKKDLHEKERKRKKEVKEELEKLNKQRTKRELEQQQRELTRIRAQKDLNVEFVGDWKTRETTFSIDQDRRRAEIRIKEDRAQPIDYLTLRLAVVNDDSEEGFKINLDSLAMEEENPYKILDRLTLEEANDLKNDILIKLSSHFDMNDEESIKYWKNIITICDFHLERLNAIHMNISQSRVSYEVLVEIEKMLEQKTIKQLDELKEKVNRKLKSNEPIDVDYWEQTLKSLTVYEAKENLNIFHKRFIKKYETLKKEGKINKKEIEDKDVLSMKKLKSSEEPIKKDHKTITYDPSMSPLLIHDTNELTKSDLALSVIDETEDVLLLSQMRKEVVSVGFVSKENREMAIRKADNDLQVLLFERYKTDENSLEEELKEYELQHKKPYTWQDKYKPRKPKYFNRVITGFEWNKYNQTHYDKNENPPPKVVQGYKFNIFYPDLICEENKKLPPTPIYKLEPDDTSKDHIIIRFISSPPYEDIAFKIINKRWDYSTKNGFRCNFDKGILQLHFKFRRSVYRR